MASDAMSGRARILPMETAGTHNFIERTYREGGAYQWCRETYTNTVEAVATRIEFGIEWQAVEALGIYRRTISDNGRGMSAEELVEFFNTFGGGSRPIGGVHENFGVGAKTSLLPWNRHGVVVVSWVDGLASMIWVKWDAEVEEYGLRLLEAEDPESGDISLESVYEPFIDTESGCDWSRIKPHWIDRHGTVIVLLGNDGTEDTVTGDPGRAESDIRGISAYLNRRIWDLPASVEVYVDEFRTIDRSQWPRSAKVGHGSQPKLGPDRRTNLRRLEGARYYIENPSESFKSGAHKQFGTVGTRDGTEIDWVLWEGARPAVRSYAAIGGYVGALYKGELYDVTFHPATYRSFGITEASVRRNLWLIIRPPILGDDGETGVYPRTDRNALLLKEGPGAGRPLPMSDWGSEFADLMPQEIIDAIGKARDGQEGTLDDSWRQKLTDRFGSRWRIPNLRARANGSRNGDAAQDGSRPRRIVGYLRSRSRTGGGTGGRTGHPRIGTRPGALPAEKHKVPGGIPAWVTVGADDIEDGALAAWAPHHPGHPEGAVLINVDHAVLRADIEHYQSQYADVHAVNIAQEVIKAYGQIAVSKVAHSEHLKRDVASAIIDQKYRSPEALTMSLLGLLATETVIAPRIGGRYGKRSGPA